MNGTFRHLSFLSSFSVCLILINSLLGQGAGSMPTLDYMPPGHAAIVEEKLPDARKLDGGIRFIETRKGEGPVIKKGDKITALYIGRLLDGTIFNQKRSRLHMFEFEVGATPPQIIQGWERTMSLMQKGGKYTIAIPSQFAYRDKGRENQVPPYATVIFDIEIVNVEQ